MEARFARLNTGAWGIRIVGAAPAAGAKVVVAKRDGSRSTVVIDRVVWQSDGIVLCSIGATGAGSGSGSGGGHSQRSRSGWRPCGYPGCSRFHCDECDGQGGRW